MSPLAARIAVVLFMVALLEAATRLGWLDPQFISSPSTIVVRMGQLLMDPQIAEAYWLTARQMLIGFALACVVGIPFGLVVGLSSFLYRICRPIVLLLFGIPQSTILPLFILFLGIGDISKIMFGATHAIFPIVFMTMAGARTVDPRLIVAARSMGAGPLAILGKVVIPSIWPTLLSGLRLAVSQCMLGVLLAQLWVGHGDAGFYVKLFSNSFRSADLLAVVVTISLVTVVLVESLRRLETRFRSHR